MSKWEQNCADSYGTRCGEVGEPLCPSNEPALGCIKCTLRSDAQRPRAHRSLPHRARTRLWELMWRGHRRWGSGRQSQGRRRGRRCKLKTAQYTGRVALSFSCACAPSSMRRTKGHRCQQTAGGAPTALQCVQRRQRLQRGPIPQVSVVLGRFHYTTRQTACQRLPAGGSHGRLKRGRGRRRHSRVLRLMAHPSYLTYWHV